MRRITIIGFGRFGRTLYELLKDDFEITVYRRSPITEKLDAKVAKSLEEAYANDVIFYAVPISSFEKVIAAHKKYFKPRHLLIDVLSVKMHPAKVLTKQLAGTKAQALLTHPMFGPDSTRESFDGLPIIMDRFKASAENYKYWKDYFTRKKLKVVEMSPEQHDKMAANSQGLTHFVGRLLEEYGLGDSPIDTLGAKKLLEIKEQTTGDSWQLFNDLQHYNPYTKKMRLKLGEAYDEVYNKLLPNQASPDYLTIGIQGGKGSFNEEAVMYWLKRSGVKDYKIKYLHTTKKVLAALHSGEVDRGLFAIHNSVGGVVGESIEAMARYKFTIVEEFAIIIAHALMIRGDAEYGDVTTIMSHPQVFAQCKHTLPQKYPHLKLESGKGELIDHAKVAERLGAHKLPTHVGTMGSKILADIYGLKVVEDNLQDAKENYTSFLMVKR
ncbi:MAG TPA: prephenate dehydrogenase/arogenate dehydrogenase family protein [Candidatus Saccharimonadales bacterium]|nr:prephenate dehydrogenase/arogenate dehydrogenase family protein [Candidatus Saccharimonadales bacterium]